MSTNIHNLSLKSLCGGLFLLLPPLAIVAVMSLTQHPAAPGVAFSESAADPRLQTAHFTPWWRSQLRQSYEAAIHARDYAADAKTSEQAQAGQKFVMTLLVSYNELAGEAPPATFQGACLPRSLTIEDLTKAPHNIPR